MTKLGKRKRAAARGSGGPAGARPQLRRVAELRDQVRDKRKATRQLGNLSLGDDDDDDDNDDDNDNDDEEEEEEEEDDDDEDDEDDDDDEEEEEDDEEPPAAVPPPPPQPPRDIDSKKLPVLLSLFCGPKAITGETMFNLESIGSIAEIKGLLGKHFFWEMKRVGVPSDLLFMRMNCIGPDKEGPLAGGAWPISTAEVYQQWYDSLLAGSWKHGQFARVQVVAMTDHMLWRDEKTYRDYLKLDENPIPFWFTSPVEDYQGERWVFDQPMGEPVDGREWGAKDQ